MSESAANGDAPDVVVTHPPPLTHRTDRFTYRNTTGTPVVFVGVDPLPLGPIDDVTLQSQRSPVEADDLGEVQETIEAVMKRAKANTGRHCWYGITGQRAGIAGNGLEDFNAALTGFRTTYADLEDQLEAPGEREVRGWPHEPMRVTGAVVTRVDGVWFRFIVSLIEDKRGEHHLGTSIWTTTTRTDRHGPLVARWLDHVLDLEAVGPPGQVERQSGRPQKRIGLDDNPRRTPRELRYIGVSDEREGDEFVTVSNPCYDPDNNRGMFSVLEETGVPDKLPRVIQQIDRVPLRAQGGTHGIDEDVYLGQGFEVTQLGKTDGVALLSGTTMPKKRQRYEKETQVERSERGMNGLLSRL